MKILAIWLLGTLSFSVFSAEDQLLSKKIYEKLDYEHSTTIKEKCNLLNEQIKSNVENILERNPQLTPSQINAKANYRIEKRNGRGINLQHAHICELNVRLTSDEHLLLNSRSSKLPAANHSAKCNELLDILKNESSFIYGEIDSGLRRCVVEIITVHSKT